MQSQCGHAFCVASSQPHIWHDIHLIVDVKAEGHPGMQGGLGLISGVDVYHLLARHAASSMVHHRINAAIPAAHGRRASVFTVTAISQQRGATACSQCGAAGKQRRRQFHYFALTRHLCSCMYLGSTSKTRTTAGKSRACHCCSIPQAAQAHETSPNSLCHSAPTPLST